MTVDAAGAGDLCAALSGQRSVVGTWGHRAPARVRLVRRWASGRVIDIGCSGDGYLSLLPDSDASFGTDILWPDHRPRRFTLADAVALPFRSDAFDTALLFEVLEHAADPVAMLQEISRTTRRLVLTVPNCEQPPEFAAAGLAFHHWVDRTHVNFYDGNLLESHLAEGGWTLIDLRQVNPVAPETLSLTSWRVPWRLARAIGVVLKRLPFRRRYYMSIAAVAERSESRR